MGKGGIKRPYPANLAAQRPRSGGWPRDSAAPEAKRHKSSQLSPQEVIDKVGEAAIAELAEVISQVLSDAHDGGAQFLEGNKLSKAIMEQMPGAAANAKEALGGKGWLRSCMA